MKEAEASTTGKATTRVNRDNKRLYITKPRRDIPGTILAKGLTLGTDMFETGLNNNTLIVGVPGGGKTQSFVKPNIYQGNSSLVITDPKGSLIEDCGWMLEEMGYEVVKLDLLNPWDSDGYNPLQYVRTAEDVTALAHAITYSMGEGYRSKEAFWDEAPKLLLRAVITLAKRLHGDRATLYDVVHMLKGYAYAPLGSRSGVSNRLEEQFDELKTGLRYQGGEYVSVGKGEPNHPAVELWNQFNSVCKAQTTLSCIMIELWTKLSCLTDRGIQRILSSWDSLDFGELGRRRVALFLIVSDVDRSLDFLTSVFYTQLFSELCRVARNECQDNNERLHVPVRVIMDDFANQAPIPNFDTLIAALRSRDIWLSPVCQSVAQLRQKYGDAAATILGCCDVAIYLGVNDLATAEEISVRADIPVAEVQQMPIGKAVVFVRGREPFIGDRYDVTDHPNYRFSRQADANHGYQKNRFWKRVGERRLESLESVFGVAKAEEQE